MKRTDSSLAYGTGSLGEPLLTAYGTGSLGEPLLTVYGTGSLGEPLLTAIPEKLMEYPIFWSRNQCCSHS